MSNFQAPDLIDSHCHLDLQQFDADRADVIARARAAGVTVIVNPGIDLDHCRHALELAAQIGELYVAVGIHPNSAGTFDDDTIDTLGRMTTHPKVVAIGEIGLDFYWEMAAPEIQQHAFLRQLDLAAELGLPVIVHSRDANEAVAEVLRSWVASESFRQSPLARRPYAGVLHAYSGDLALAEEAYAWNFLLGLGGPVTFRNAHALREMIPGLRIDRLMIETDAPYLAPHPYRGKRNEPANVTLVCKQLAQLYALAPSEVAAQTTATALRFYGLEDRFGVDFSTRHAAVHP
ncbi:MAG: TatD family hydrolase [Caldilinea sp.]